MPPTFEDSRQLGYLLGRQSLETGAQGLEVDHLDHEDESRAGPEGR